MNVFHAIDPEVVAAEIERKVAKLEADIVERTATARQWNASYDENPKGWARRPSQPEEIERILRRCIRAERNYYAKARVLQRPKGFYLVYLDEPDDDHGTGPFLELDHAVNWFTKGGR